MGSRKGVEGGVGGRKMRTERQAWELGKASRAAQDVGSSWAGVAQSCILAHQDSRWGGWRQHCLTQQDLVKVMSALVPEGQAVVFSEGGREGEEGG